MQIAGRGRKRRKGGKLRKEKRDEEGKKAIRVGKERKQGKARKKTIRD